jgi:putative transposase
LNGEANQQHYGVTMGLSTSLALWSTANQRQITLLHIHSGKPTQNAYTERFNRTARYEWLDMYHFDSVEQTQQLAT